MKLTELDPRWVNAEKTVFVFRCPHCASGAQGRLWISCKRVPMAIGDQFELFIAANLAPNGRGADVVPMREDCAWTFTGDDFETLSVHPSIDASRAGHWHGFITNGEIR